MPIKFALIGDGTIAKYHREAIKHVGGELICVVDPKYPLMEGSSVGWIPLIKIEELSSLYPMPDYVIVCSPSNFHRLQIQKILALDNFNGQIICEKPAFLPWEQIIDSDRINIVLQLRYLPNLPKKADLVSVRFVRDESYFQSWKGDARNTGGLFFSLFIHYIDLANRLGADFEGIVFGEGDQERWVGTKWSWTNGLCSETQRIDPVKYIDDENKIDILNIDNQACYNRMYEAILSGNGIKPKDSFYLNWILNRNSEIFGYGRDGLNKTITIKNELI